MREFIFKLVCKILGYKPGEYQKVGKMEIELILRDKKVIKGLNKIRDRAKEVNKLLEKVYENRPTRV